MHGECANQVPSPTLALVILVPVRLCMMFVRILVCFTDGFSSEFCPLDLLWIDFGAGPRLSTFFEAWWPRLSENGGCVISLGVTVFKIKLDPTLA